MPDIRQQQHDKQVVIQGIVFGLPDGLEFNSNRPYRACMLCGAVFQGPLDLKVPAGHTPENSLVARLAAIRRQEWAERHSAKVHTLNEHKLLQLSGRFATPIASQRLAALGIFSLVDIVIDEEVESALKEANPMPDREIERS